MKKARSFVGYLLAMVVLLSQSSLVLADDSSAEEAAGSIQFLKNTDIEMKSERLYVSPKLVQVDFIFKNTANHPITTLMAFPLPKITLDRPTTYKLSPHDVSNYVNFKIWVEGKNVKQFVRDGKAWTQECVQEKNSNNEEVGCPDDKWVEKDITPLLKKYNLPIIPDIPKNRKIFESLPELIEDEIGYDGWGPIPWTAQPVYTWQQTFPAGKSIHIRHQYSPLIGTGFWFKGYSTDGEGNLEGLNFQESEYIRRQSQDLCLNNETIMRLFSEYQKKYPDKKFTDFSRDGATVGYVLTTGNNWKGPIGDFTLILDKLRPTSELHTCWPDLEQISPTQYQFKQTNFSPKSDLHFLIWGDVDKDYFGR